MYLVWKYWDKESLTKTDNYFVYKSIIKNNPHASSNEEGKYNIYFRLNPVRNFIRAK